MANDTTCSCEQEELTEEDYISFTTFQCYSLSSPSQTKDFEFHLTSTPLGKEDLIACPADELFYKGNLLPLHLHPRMQMLKNLLLANSIINTNNNTTMDHEKDSNPEFKRNSEGFYFHDSVGVNHTANNITKVLSKKKLTESTLSLKLKASRAYIKSLFFTKTGCSDESRGLSKSGKKKKLYFQIRREKCCVDDIERRVEEGCVHRRSFTGAINRHQITKKSPSFSSCSCSTSSSFSSACSSIEHSGTGNGAATTILKRSSSVGSEVENPIQGAIAYCKKTQQSITGKNSLQKHIM